MCLSNCVQTLHEDVAKHQPLVFTTVEEASRFLQEHGPRLRDADRTKLQDITDNLQSRYDVVNNQSNQRQTKQNFGFNDLNKYEQEADSFTNWLDTAERSLQQAQKNVPQDLEDLQRQIVDQKTFTEDVNDQKGDLKFINMTGQKFINDGKVGGSVHILSLRRRKNS